MDTSISNMEKGKKKAAEKSNKTRPSSATKTTFKTVASWFAFSLVLTQMHSFNGKDWAKVYDDIQGSMEQTQTGLSDMMGFVEEKAALITPPEETAQAKSAVERRLGANEPSAITLPESNEETH